MKYRLPDGAKAYWRKGKFYLAGMVVDLPDGVNPRADMVPVEEEAPEPKGKAKRVK